MTALESDQNPNVLSDLLLEIKALQTRLQKRRSRLVRAKSEISVAEALIQKYFRNVRPIIKSTGIDVSGLDDIFSKLHEISSGTSLRSSYSDVLRRARVKATELEIQYEFSFSASSPMAEHPLMNHDFTLQERRVVDTLLQINSHFANAYIQIIRDLADKNRVSFRGVIHEMRELLRGVLNHFAPDQQVAAQPNFKLEEGQTKPTRTQKMQYILSTRNLSSAQIDPAKKTTHYLDVQTQVLAAMPSAIYGAGSDSAHAQPRDLKSEVYRLKHYLDANLCDILEVN